MALPSALTIKAEFLYSYKNDNPKLRLTDQTDYAAEGRVAANIRGIFKITDANGKTVYDNTSFDAANLDLSVSNVVTLNLIGCGCSGKFDLCGNLTIQYSIQDVSNNAEFTKSFTNFLCFTPFEAKLNWKLDCYTATLSSTDCSNYKQGGIIPVMSDYAHTLTSLNKKPLDFEKIKTSFNFECGKEVTPEPPSETPAIAGKGVSTLTSIIPYSFIFTLNETPNNQTYTVQVITPNQATLTIKNASNTVIHSSNPPIGIHFFPLAIPNGQVTVTMTTLSSVSNGGVEFSLLRGSNNVENQGNSQGDAYSKCCNTLTLSYPELYSGLHKHAVSSDLIYDFGSNWFVVYTVNYCEEFEVECSTDLCKITCALYDKYTTYLSLLCQNPLKASELKEKLQWAYSKLSLHTYLLKCGYEQKATKVIEGILADLGISKTDCGCGCSGDNCEPQKILPILNKDAYVPPQIMILEGEGIDIRLDNITDSNVNAYVISSEVNTEYDEYEYLAMPFTSTNLITPMKFAAPDDSQIEISAIYGEYISSLSYSVNRGSFQPVTLPLSNPITIAASAHVVWKATITTAGNPELESGSINIKYKTI